MANEWTYTPEISDYLRSQSLPRSSEISTNDYGSTSTSTSHTDLHDTDNVGTTARAPINDQKHPQLNLNHRQEASRNNIMKELESEMESVYSGQYEEGDEACCTRCIDVCCQAYPCTDDSLCSDNLCRGRTDGSKYLLKAVFPLITDHRRIFWILAELTVVLVALGFSIEAHKRDNKPLNTAQLTLSLVAFFLVVIDFVITISSKRVPQQDTEQGDEQDHPEKCCKRCFLKCKSMFDVFRLILSEAIFYPMMICDLFEVTAGMGLEGNTTGDYELKVGDPEGNSTGNPFGTFLVFRSLLSMVFTVYVTRIVVLFIMLKNISAIRIIPMHQDGRQLSSEQYNPEIKQSALYYQGCFFVHVIIQMLAQLSMYIAIAARILFDSRHSHVSIHLIYMIFSGYVLPTLGLLAFFIVTYDWARQYPIGFRLDMMSSFMIMTRYKVSDLMDPGNMISETRTRIMEMIDKLDKLDNIRFQPLKKDFNEIFNKIWYKKFLYPFTSPSLFIICLVYATLQLAVLICATTAVDEMGVIATHILNGGGWVGYYIFAAIIEIIANLYAIIVGALWIAIIAGFVIIIVTDVFCFICIAFTLYGLFYCYKQ